MDTENTRTERLRKSLIKDAAERENTLKCVNKVKIEVRALAKEINQLTKEDDILRKEYSQFVKASAERVKSIEFELKQLK